MNYSNNYYVKKFNTHGDQRGSLIAIEAKKNLPFDIKRMYYIFNTVPDFRRGCHAHHTLKQCLVCVSGSCKVLVDDGSKPQTIDLRL